jgi:hypothetical protein
MSPYLGLFQEVTTTRAGAVGDTAAQDEHEPGVEVAAGLPLGLETAAGVAAGPVTAATLGLTAGVRVSCGRGAAA